MQHLQQTAPELIPACERVALKPGPWPGPDGMGDDCLYFPETGLLALSLPASPGGPWASRSTRMAMFGCHSVWSPRQAQASDFLAEVLIPGHAMRVSDAVVRAAHVSLAKWWLQVAASNQQLMSQMARMALCAQKHSPTQSLASCLLMAQHNCCASPLQIPMAALRAWLDWSPDAWQSAWHALESQGAVALAGQGTSATIQIQEAERLSGLACACHQMVRHHDTGPGSRG